MAGQPFARRFARYGVQADDIAVAADKLANFADRGRAAMSL